QALVALGILWGSDAANVFCDEWKSVDYHGGIDGYWEVACDPHGMVTDLSMYIPYQGFGVVPEAITALSALQTLGLSMPGYNGSAEILGHFPNLQYVDLSYTTFSGSIPESIGNAKSLQYMGLGGNNVSGPIPASLGSLVNLTSLDVSSNHLNGSLPDSITRLALLQHL
ncbi:unnamed protein product, partial [Closterium sp. Naga37s-1]